jgi:hypothetical protein
VNPLFQSIYLALFLAAAILLSTLLATQARAATASTSIERTPSTWEFSGSGVKLPQERLDTGTPIEPHTGMRLSSSANVSHSHSY